MTSDEYELEEVLGPLLVAYHSVEDDRAKRYLGEGIETLLQEGKKSEPPTSSSDPISVGEQVPAFELPGVDDDGIGQFSLSEFLTDGPLVVSFYPFDFSPVCTTQLCQFRDVEWLSVGATIDVVGISVDSVYSHRQFREEYGLQFPLLTDRMAAVADRFGVKYEEWEHHPSVAKRALFVVDQDRTVRYRWYTEDATEEPSLDDLEASIEWTRT